MSHGKLQKTRSADSSASAQEECGLREVPESVGQEIQRNGESETHAQDSSNEAIVPTSSKFVAVRDEANKSCATTVTVDDLSPFNRRALEMRAEEIDSEYENEQLETTFPIQVLETARQWLRSKNLIWASNDNDFWTAFEYVLGSLETFSIDAVEQALIICTTQATNNPARRAAIYQELRACRAIKKIRDLELKIKTAQVIANHVLSVPFQTQAKYEGIRSYTKISIREYPEEIKEKPETVEIPDDQIVAYQLGHLHNGVWEAYGRPGTLKDAQNLRERVIAMYGRKDREPEIHVLGVSAEGKIVKDYGVADEE